MAVAARQICNVALNADAWTIATMPVKYGGLGLHLSTNAALHAYLASTAISTDLVDLMLSTNSYILVDAKRVHWTAPFPQS